MLGQSQGHHDFVAPPAAQVGAQLQKILASEPFVRSERMSTFLRYIVEQTLAGNGQTLKEPVIAQDCFGRGADFEGAADPIVRVEARRLRDKLREYYEGAQSEPVLIKLPKGAYVPSFERNAGTIPVVVPPRPETAVLRSSRQIRPRVLWMTAMLALTLIAVAAWYGLRSDPLTLVRRRHLSFQGGNEFSPSLSPDGNSVVFGWANGGPADLYIKAVDGESLRRLTESPQHEFSPAWSPDGQHIAFLRGGGGVFTISVHGGAERKIAQTARFWFGESGESGQMIAWSANSKSILLNDVCASSVCIYEIALETLERRQITTNQLRRGDIGFAASPHGRTLAVVRNLGRPDVNDIFLVPLAGGEARRLTTQNRAVDHVAWTPDGKYVIYSVLEGTRFRLWRTAARIGSGNGQPLSALGEWADMPSVARSAGTGLLRIAYRTRIHDVSLRIARLNMDGNLNTIGTAAPFADATEGRDCSARFSPDANQIAFFSVRTGEARMWLANRDGSGLRPLTSIVAQEVNPGGWSPDGNRLAFDAHIADNSDIYITDSAGAQPFRLTSEPSTEASPSWSRDGRWIYFASDRTGHWEVWKAPAAGGTATRLTFQGGYKPQPSTDGKYVYYVQSTGTQKPLKRIPVRGGEESTVLEGVAHHNFWTVTSKGIYLVARERSGHYLDLYDPVMSRRARLGAFPFPVAPPIFCGFISASQDGGYVIANHTDRDETNIGLMELR
jgi:Tol biopolymer transport system component